MEEAGNQHSQQTDIRTENQTPHVVTHKWVLNNENTWKQRGKHHTVGPAGGGEARGGITGIRGLGEIILGEIPNVDNRVMDAANYHHGMYITM